MTDSTHTRGILKRAARRAIRPSSRGAIYGQLTRAYSQVLIDRTRAARRAGGEPVGLVTARVFPDATAGVGAPAYIDLATRTVYGDAHQLFGTALEHAEAGRPLTEEQRAALLVGDGAIHRHEGGHALHTDPAVIRAARDLIWEVRLLEEPRMEGRVIATQGAPARAALGAACRTLIASEIDRNPPADRAGAVGASVLLVGRAHAGVLEDREVARLRKLCGQALGPQDMVRLEALLARVVHIADGDAEAMRHAARELRELVGIPPGRPAADGTAAGRPRADTADRPRDGNRPAGPDQDGQPARPAEPLAPELGEAICDAMRDAVAEAAHRTRGELGHGGAADRAADEIERALARAIASDAARAEGPPRLLAGIPSGELVGGIDGWRAPHLRERSAAARLARELRRIKRRRSAREGRVMPPGRFNGRGAVAQAAQQARGACVTGEAFRAKVRRRAELYAPHVAVAIDTSGSMGDHAAALGSVLWTIARAFRAIDGELCAAGFGNAASVLATARTARRLVEVPDIKTGGGTAFLDVALSLCEHELDLHERRRPRVAYVVSDGLWVDSEASERKLRGLLNAGCAVVHVGIGAEPAHPGDPRAQLVTVDNPLALADVVARGTRAAMQADAGLA